LSPQVIVLVGRDRFWLEELIHLVDHVQGLEYATWGYRNSLSNTTKGWRSVDAIMELREDVYRNDKSFLTFLRGVGNSWEATEKRDMVFAFLGLLNKPDLFEPLGFTIRADYVSPLRDIHISLTHTVIEGTRNLDILGQVIGLELVSYCRTFDAVILFVALVN
jgi:hypothetical protein